MAGAALGALSAGILGSLAPDWALLCVCAVLVPVTAFLFHRRSAFFLLPLAAFLVFVRIVLVPTALFEDGAVPTFVNNLRESLRSNADALFSDEAAAARGILLGDSKALDASARAAFADAGLLHLFAVSGLHVTVLVGVFGKLVRTRCKWLSLAILALFLLFLCAVTGFTPSVLRASFLLIGLRLCRMRERKADMPSVFCFSMAMTLLCEPFAYATVGFQLSFSAVAGMVLLGRTLRKPFPAAVRQTKIASALTGSTAAIIGMLPLTAYYFGTLAWISIPLSILLIPTMPILLLTGFLSVLLYGVLPHVAMALSYPAYGAIKLISLVAENLNVPALRVRAPHPAVIALYFAALLFLSPLFLPNRRHPRWIGIGLLLAAVLLWFLL
jgi:competence protein ComEC